MSRAFVKEPDGESPDDLPELPLSPHPNRVTPRGLSQLQQRLDAATLRAQAAGRGSNERALAERECRWLQNRIASALVIPSASQAKDRVSFGASVTIRDEHDVQQRYRIVGEDEAQPAQGLVSWVSPLAQVLNGAHVGDVVTWPRPAGNIEIEVLDINHEADAPHDGL